MAIMKLGSWEVDCDLHDGARIRRLRYDGLDLLTTAPTTFTPPSRDFGRYETRPVYGYDDCFPTVEVCDGWPDHGEVCWLEWTGSTTECWVQSRRAPVTFTRRLAFADRELVWSFVADNHGHQILPVQHVMHALMPLDEISAMSLPACQTHDSAALAQKLLSLPRGSVEMLFLQEIVEGTFTLRYRQGLRLTVTFPHEMFPTLGIWWNNTGYPDEDGRRRNECALQPTPGRTSRLSDGTTLRLLPQGHVAWQVHWKVVP